MRAQDGDCVFVSENPSHSVPRAPRLDTVNPTGFFREGQRVANLCEALAEIHRVDRECVDASLHALHEGSDVIGRFEVGSNVAGQTREEYLRLPQPLYICPPLLPSCPGDLIDQFRDLTTNRCVRRVFHVKPFPADMFSDLVRRMIPHAVALGPSSHWSDAVWLGAGGGVNNNGLGYGPMSRRRRDRAGRRAADIPRQAPVLRGSCHGGADRASG